MDDNPRRDGRRANLESAILRALEIDLETTTRLRPLGRLKTDTGALLSHAQMAARLSRWLAVNKEYEAALWSLTIAAERLGAADRLPFVTGRKKPRTDRLRHLIVEAIRELPATATAREILERCAENDKRRPEDQRVILEIERDDPKGPVIHWRRSRGSEAMLNFHSFEKRVGRLRKKKL